MAFSLDAWNVDVNRTWYVRLSDAGSTILVGLYLTQANAEAQTSRQAYGSTTGFGSSLPVTLTNENGATVPVALYQDTYTWHLQVSGQDGDATKVYRLKEFIELDEISHPIYRNADLINTRATAEIDAHTHAVTRKELDLGSHIPTLEPGQVVRLNSTRRGKDEKMQVLEHRVSGEVSDGGEMKLTNTITVASYLELKR